MGYQYLTLRDDVVSARFGGVFSALIVAAPWFIFRVPGTSLSIVDVLITLALLMVLAHLVQYEVPASSNIARQKGLFYLGFAFMFLGLFSGIEAILFARGVYSVKALFESNIQYGFIMLVFPAIALYFVKIFNIRTFLRLVGLAYLIPMVISILLIYPGTPEYLKEIFFTAGRARGVYGNPNAFAGVLAITTSIYVVLGIVDKGIWKLVGIIGLPMALANLLITASFGGVLVFVCIVVLNFILSFFWRRHPFRSHPAKSLQLLLIVIVIGIATFMLIKDSEYTEGMRTARLDQISSLGEGADVKDFGSAAIRIALIDESFEMITSRGGGIFGHGLGQSKHVSKYNYDVHLLYLLLWIEGGVVLLGVYLLFLILLLRNAIALAAIDPPTGLAMGMGVVAIILYGLVNPHIYLRYYWIPVLPCFVNFGYIWDKVTIPQK